MLLKPHWIVPFLAYLLGCRRFKVLGWVCLFTLVSGLAAFICFGAETFQNYLPQAKSLVESPWRFQVQEAVSLTAQIYRFMPHVSYPSIMSFTAPIFCCAVLLLIWLGNRYRDSQDWLERGIACAFPLGIACAVYYSPYDMVFVLPSLIIMLKPSNFVGLPVSSKVSIGIATCLLMNPLYHWIMNKLAPDYSWVINPQYVGMLILAVAAVRFVLAKPESHETVASQKRQAEQVLVR
jgi:hypothetical protein